MRHLVTGFFALAFLAVAGAVLFIDFKQHTPLDVVHLAVVLVCVLIGGFLALGTDMKTAAQSAGSVVPTLLDAVRGRHDP